MTDTLTSVTVHIEQIAEQLRSAAGRGETLGRLPEDTADLLLQSGVFNLLKARKYGGAESSLEDFAAAVMKIAELNPAAGWVAGVVGVHPWEISQADPKVAEEIWGTDPDTLIASPYAPTGRARRVEGGYRFTGRWQFSSGADICQWVVLGGLVLEEDLAEGSLPEMCHFILPRGDYEIIEDSWNVIGLKGTGSKDVVITDTFVPDHRVISASELNSGATTAAHFAGHSLYELPFGTLFSYAIGSASVGITLGALHEFTEYTRSRVSLSGDATAQNPFQQATLAAAAADIDASRLQILDGARRMQEITASGRRLTELERLKFRRDQVRSVRRAVDAVDGLFAFAGGSSLRLDQPFQRYWRDSHAALNHICNVEEGIYQAYGQTAFGLDYNKLLMH